MVDEAPENDVVHYGALLIATITDGEVVVDRETYVKVSFNWAIKAYEGYYRAFLASK